MVATVEVDDSTPLSKIVGLVTQSRNASKGPTMFIFKTMLVSTTSAMIFGLGAGILAPAGLGPGFSTMLGMGAGFVGGLVHRWHTDLRHAICAMDEYPELMRFHIRQIMMNTCSLSAANVIQLEDWRADLQRSVQKQSVAIAAVYAAADALETIRRHNEEQIMEHYMARASANVTQQFS